MDHLLEETVFFLVKVVDFQVLPAPFQFFSVVGKSTHHRGPHILRSTHWTISFFVHWIPGAPHRFPCWLGTSFCDKFFFGGVLDEKLNRNKR